MKKLMLIVILLLISLTLVACDNTNDDPPVEINQECDLIEGTTILECNTTWSSYLHTVVRLRLYILEDSTLNNIDVYDEVESIISFYHDISDKYYNYDGVVNVKTINDDPTALHVISEELFDLIEFSLDHQDEVDNLFNIALGPVLKVWHDYRDNCNLSNICELPTLEELEAQEIYTNPDDIIMDRENLTITMSEFMSLDLGGVSKGYISGVIIDYLDTLDLNGYLLNNGESNITIGGTHPTRNSGEFLIAVMNPDYDYTIPKEDPDYKPPYYATVYLGDGDQLVTSGDYQQNFIVDGELYHHIINVETLFPERFSRSVSIVFEDPALADLYSTAIFSMSIEDGILFVDGVDGLEAIWYGIDGTIYFSANFETDYLNLTYE